MGFRNVRFGPNIRLGKRGPSQGLEVSSLENSKRQNPREANKQNHMSQVHKNNCCPGMGQLESPVVLLENLETE